MLSVIWDMISVLKSRRLIIQDMSSLTKNTAFNADV